MALCHWLRLTGLGLVVAASSFYSTQGKIPSGSEVPTRQEFAERETAFLTRTILEPFRAQRKDDPRTDGNDVAEEFLESWIEHAVQGHGNLDHGPLVEIGDRAVKLGCNDVMFSYCYGRLLRQVGRLEDAVKQLSYAERYWDDASYAPNYRCWTVSQLAYALRGLARSHEADQLDAGMPQLLVAAITEGNYRPDELWILHSSISSYLENYAPQKLKPIVEQVLASEKVNPWLEHLLLGKLATRFGWKARGSRYAHQVTEQQWREFGRYQAEASEHLIKAWDLNQRVPQAATEMIRIAMTGHDPDGKTPREWFDRAVSAQLDYLPAYHAMRWALMPRWGGSHRELYDFGRECLETGRFDTYVPYELIYTLDNVRADLADQGTKVDLLREQGVYDNLVSLSDGYIAEPNKKWHHHWFATLKVGLAVRTENWNDARQFFDVLDGPPHPAALARLGLKEDQAVGEILGRTGDFAQRNTEAESLIAEGDFAQAEKIFRSLTTEAGDRQEVVTYFRGKLLETEFQRKLENSEWASLLPNSHLTGWNVKHGLWSVDDQGGLVGNSKRDGLLLVADKKLGTRFEIRGKAKFVDSPFDHFGIGIYFGPEAGPIRHSFRFYRDQNYAALFRVDGQVASKPLSVGTDNTFRVRRTGNLLTAYLNDVLIFEDVAIDAEGDDESQVVGIGGRFWYEGASIRFVSLEVRKLDQTHPSSDE